MESMTREKVIMVSLKPSMHGETLVKIKKQSKHSQVSLKKPMAKSTSKTFKKPGNINKTPKRKDRSLQTSTPKTMILIWKASPHGKKEVHSLIRNL